MKGVEGVEGVEGERSPDSGVSVSVVISGSQTFGRQFCNEERSLDVCTVGGDSV